MQRDTSLLIEVDPGVYCPAEDTFLMLEALSVRPGERALEMGCGSGFLSLHMAKAGAKVTSVDLDPRAVGNTESNAIANGLVLRALRSDLFQDVDGEFDLVVFNPPYLRGAPESDDDLCWAGGEDGLAVTRRFMERAREHLRPGGRVLLIVSSDADLAAMEPCLKGWSRRTLASRTLFFEELSVLQLTPSGTP